MSRQPCLADVVERPGDRGPRLIEVVTPYRRWFGMPWAEVGPEEWPAVRRALAAIHAARCGWKAQPAWVRERADRILMTAREGSYRDGFATGPLGHPNDVLGLAWAMKWATDEAIKDFIEGRT